MKALNLIGRQFGKLQVLGEEEHRSHKRRWVCQCACGRITSVMTSDLTSGKSTGCRHCAAGVKTHGHTRTDGYKSPEYLSWQGMKARCSNPKATGYARYGGRGIVVCERWQLSFEAFLEDMGPRPSLVYSLDRIDNDGNYTPENCRWATRKEQNARDHRHVNLETWKSRPRDPITGRWA